MSTILSKDFGFKNASSILPDSMGFKSADGDADSAAAANMPAPNTQMPTQCATMIYKKKSGGLVKGLVMVVGAALVFGAVVYLVYGKPTE